MFLVMFCAMKLMIGAGRLHLRAAALVRRMAIRVSTSGDWMSAGRPHSKRETRRASSFWISEARRSLEWTICLPDSKRSLKVWKNSSWIRSLLARNWTSSRSRTSA